MRQFSRGLLGLIFVFMIVAFQNCSNQGFSVVEAGGGSSSSSSGGGVLGPAIGISPPVPVGSKITTIKVSNLESKAKTAVLFTFAMPFKPGDIPGGYSVSLVPVVPLQLDKKAAHPDGSLRHGIITVQVDLAAGETKSFDVLAAQAPASGGAISLQDVINSGYDFVANLNVAGATYSLSAKTLLQSGSPKPWLSGPLVSEWIVGSDFVSGATKHPSLAGYFHVRAYNNRNFRTDFVVENSWFERQKSSSANKDVSYTVAAGGYNATINHYTGARWHKQFWSAGDPQIYVKLDPLYLQTNRFLPRFKSMTANLSVISAADQVYTPMTGGAYGSTGCDMGGTGDNIWIGPLPLWDSFYAVSTDIKAFRYMIAQNEASAIFACDGRYISSGICIHQRDKTTGLPPTIDQYPNASASDPAVDGVPDPQTSNPYIKDTAHQPLVGYTPYLVTGDYYFLEEMVFWNAYNLIEPTANERGGTKGYWSMGQLRAMGWSYRSLAYGAYILPDAHPFKSYFTSKMVNNITRDLAYVKAQDNIFGVWSDGASGFNDYRTFFDDFYTWAIGNVVDMGWTEALPILAFKSRYNIGRMGGKNGSDNGFCFQAAASYTMLVGPTASTLFSNWAQVYATQAPNCAITASRPCGSAAMASCLGLGSDPYAITAGGSTAYYYAEMQPALAVAVQYGYGTLDDHWKRFVGGKDLPPYEDDPRFGVIPRNAP